MLGYDNLTIECLETAKTDDYNKEKMTGISSGFKIQVSSISLVLLLIASLC